MKVFTKEQFLVLEYVKANFKEVKVEIVDDLTLKVTDAKNDSANFKYDVKDKQVKVLYLN